MSETPAQLLHRWRYDAVAFVREELGAEPDRWQADALRMWSSPNPKQRIALSACVGPGKMQPKSMRVWTPDGERRWGDLRVGDRVFAEDGTPTYVTAIHDNGVRTSYRVTFDDGSSTVCGDEHLWKVRGRTERRHWEWDQKPHAPRSLESSRRQRRGETLTADGYAVLTTEQIIARNALPDGRQRQFEIPRQGAVEWPHAALPLDPYVLGVWLGDGGRGTSRYTTADAWMVEEIARRGYRQTKSARYAVTVHGLVTHLRALGIHDKYSYEKSVPLQYKQASVAQRWDLLRGLMDTDGCIATDRHCEFTSTSEALARDVMWLVRSLGGVAVLKAARSRKSYKDATGKRIWCRIAYRVTVTMPECPFLLPRKAARWQRPQARYLTRYIDTIERVEDTDSMCITVQHPSHCYLANDFIVTHNSACLAWMGWHGLLTTGDGVRHPNAAAVSITGDNLKNNLWKELSLWRERSKSGLLKDQFDMTSESIRHTTFPATWFLNARNYARTADAEAQGRTLSGLHSGSIFALIDESGDIPPPVARAAEQTLSEEDCRFGRIVQAGNPTSHTGMLYQSLSAAAHLWSVIRITGDPDDPDRSPRVSVDWAREQIRLYGRDNPWVMAAVLGKFPPTGLNQLLGVEEVDEAMKRHVREDAYMFSQKRIGVDVARFGDDPTVLSPRQGRAAFAFVEMRAARTQEIAARIAAAKEKWGSELEVIDSTGGYAAGTVDQCLIGGIALLEVNFSGKADDPRFFNKRAEMWWRMADWIKTGGSLPNDDDLRRELTTPTYTYQDGRLRLEEKDQIKKRLGGHSPDKADALALTFALAELPRGATIPGLGGESTAGRALADWDPIDDTDRAAPKRQMPEPRLVRP